MTAVALFLMLLLIAFQIFGQARFLHGKGTVDLLNLQEARLALSTLRRDVSCACPYLDRGDSGGVRLKTLLRPIAPGPRLPAGQKSAPILVSDHELSFHRFWFQPDAPAAEPVLMPVQYVFDGAAGTLTRTDPRGSRTFKGIREALFRLYLHQGNPAVPLIWVRLKVQEEVPGTTPQEPLELTTTLSSTFAADSLNFPSSLVRGLQY